MICYDARFPDIFRFFETEKVEVVAIPAAFSQTTGAAHWDVLMRSRAVDYQVFLAAACPAPNLESTYVTFGHSLIVDPWGKVIAQAGEDAGVIHAALEAGRQEEVRRQLPLLEHRREELYRAWKVRP
jgi:predicted amidohydrolase